MARTNSKVTYIYFAVTWWLCLSQGRGWRITLYIIGLILNEYVGLSSVDQSKDSIHLNDKS